jgi:hypothetical protein
VASYDVILKDRTIEVIDGADAYQQEGQMTTFFATGEGKQVVDCWSTRLASFRTSEILIIRRLLERDEQTGPEPVRVERTRTGVDHEPIALSERRSA